MKFDISDVVKVSFTIEVNEVSRRLELVFIFWHIWRKLRSFLQLVKLYLLAGCPPKKS